MRLLVAATYCDIELDHASPLARTLEELQRTGSISRIRLRGLVEGEVAVMVRGLSHRDPLGQLVKVIFDETQGNPFFVEELYKYLVEEGKVLDASEHFRLDVKVDEVDVPDKIRLVMGRRLDRLGELGRQILTAAAVIDRSFGFKLLETVPQHVDVNIGRVAEYVGILAGARATTTAPESIPTRAASLGCPGYGLDNRQAGARGTLGVVVVGLGIAEECHHAVTQELGDVATEARYHNRGRPALAYKIPRICLVPLTSAAAYPRGKICPADRRNLQFNVHRQRYTGSQSWKLK